MILNGQQHTTFVPRYTMVHGQCLTVGVGGFILGGGEQLLIRTQVQNMPVVCMIGVSDHHHGNPGINALGTTARYGWGAENVLQMRVTVFKFKICNLS